MYLDSLQAFQLILVDTNHYDSTINLFEHQIHVIKLTDVQDDHWDRISNNQV
jgi:hypothetical protein